MREYRVKKEIVKDLRCVLTMTMLPFSLKPDQDNGDFYVAALDVNEKIFDTMLKRAYCEKATRERNDGVYVVTKTEKERSLWMSCFSEMRGAKNFAYLDDMQGYQWLF